MSARFFKIFSAVLVAHLALISAVWIGFSVPLPRPPATFTYEGAVPADDADNPAEEPWQQAEASTQFSFDPGSFNSNPWIKFRDLSKPSVQRADQ